MRAPSGPGLSQGTTQETDAASFFGVRISLERCHVSTLVSIARLRDRPDVPASIAPVIVHLAMQAHGVQQASAIVAHMAGLT
jgi:hypothetical protein